MESISAYLKQQQSHCSTNQERSADRASSSKKDLLKSIEFTNEIVLYPETP